MSDFTEQDLSDSRFDRVLLRRASFRDVSLEDATFTGVNLAGARIRSAWLDGVRLTGVEVPDLEIHGELRRLVVNGVDVVAFVEAELDRRMPERPLMRPTDTAGFREAFAVLDRLWGGTVEAARALPPALLHECVDGEWSFTETVRHLGFAHACWVGGVVLADPDPWHPLDLPWDEAPAAGARRRSGRRGPLRRRAPAAGHVGHGVHGRCRLADGRRLPARRPQRGVGAPALRRARPGGAGVPLIRAPRACARASDRVTQPS